MTDTRNISRHPHPYTYTHPLQDTQSAQNVFHSGQGGTGIDQEHQGSHVHQGEWPLPKQELRKIPATTNMGSGTRRNTFTAPQVTTASPVLSHPPTWTLPPSPTPSLHKGGGTNLFLGKILGMLTHGGVTVTLHTPLHTPKIPLFLDPYIYSTIFGKDQYFISLTFSLGPDEAAIVWWLWKLVW